MLPPEKSKLFFVLTGVAQKDLLPKESIYFLYLLETPNSNYQASAGAPEYFYPPKPGLTFSLFSIIILSLFLALDSCVLLVLSEIPSWLAMSACVYPSMT